MSESGTVHCPHAARCGGCALIDRDPQAQLAWKLNRVKQGLRPYASMSTIACTAIRGTASLIGYRTRTKLMVDARGAIGLYARDSHDVVDIPDCRVMSELTRRTVDALRPLLVGSGVEAVDVRETHDSDAVQLLVTLIAGAASVERARALVPRVASIPHVVSVAVSARDRHAVQLLGRDLVVLHGPAHTIDRTDPSAPYVHASHGAFVQAHRGQAAALQGYVIELLRGALGDLSRTRIVELHAGEGGLGLRLARLGAAMLLVDSFEPAIQRVRDAARAQGLVVEAWARDATEALERLLESRQAVNAVLLDPPRRGVPALLRRVLADLKPRAVVYVSCGPESFARDLDHLRWLGYATGEITPFDLIPLTAEVECVALLRPAPLPLLTVLYEDGQVAIVDKPAHLPTTPQTGHATSLVDIARKQLNAPGLTAVDRLDAEASGVCLLARDSGHVHAWSEALAQGEKRYQALVRGITRDKGSINRPLREGSRVLDARTRFKRNAVIGGHSLITALPDEGHAQQIRRHLSSLDHPILGDSRHGDPRSNRYLEHKHGLDRLFLHCASITLIAPTSGAQITVETPLAADLSAVLNSMRS